MDNEELQDIIMELGEEYNVPYLETQQYYEATRDADILQIRKRINGEKFGIEMSIGNRMYKNLPSDEDSLIIQELEQHVRAMKEGILDEMGTTFQYHDREIICGLDTEVAEARCTECGHNIELGRLPHVVKEQGSLQTFNTMQTWRQQKLACYMLERID